MAEVEVIPGLVGHKSKFLVQGTDKGQKYRLGLYATLNYAMKAKGRAIESLAKGATMKELAKDWKTLEGIMKKQDKILMKMAKSKK